MVEPPLGGIAFSPWIPCLTNASRLPCLSSRSFQAAASPSLGAFISPEPWQVTQSLSYSPLALKDGSRAPLPAAAPPSVLAVALASAAGVSAAGVSAAGGAGAAMVSCPTGARRDACNSLSMVMLSSLPPQKKKGKIRNTGMKSAAIVMMILVFCGMSVCAMMMLHLRKFIRDLPRKLSQTRPGGASICPSHRVHCATFATRGI